MLAIIASISCCLSPCFIKLMESAYSLSNPGMYLIIPKYFYLLPFALGLGYWAIFVWALWQPLPASLVGLVVYTTNAVAQHVITFTDQVEQRGHAGRSRTGRLRHRGAAADRRAGFDYRAAGAGGGRGDEGSQDRARFG